MLRMVGSRCFTAKWKLDGKKFFPVPGTYENLTDKELGLTWNNGTVYTVYCSFQSMCKHGLETDARKKLLFPRTNTRVTRPESSTENGSGTDNASSIEDDEEIRRLQISINKLTDAKQRRSGHSLPEADHELVVSTFKELQES